MTGPRVVFEGDVYEAPAGGLTIGRRADVVLDERNRRLHRTALQVFEADGFWWLRNIGDSLSATVVAVDGSIEALLRPGGRLALVSGDVTVRVAAGPFTYDFILVPPESNAGPSGIERPDDDPTQLPDVHLSDAQRLVLLALCEPVLRDGILSLARLPSAERIAHRVARGSPRRLTTKAVAKVLEHLGTKFVRAGAQAGRRREIAEFAIDRRLVRLEDLALLDFPGAKDVR
ncbi:hypothetical protein [Pseudolysinimonas sp.]|jgi:hypothetical protein|uniref:hypothetical protein n=1 Tax=Pseudolysinimonas sp. TaxID=2680009 RepID=UPI0037838A1D